MGIEKFFLVFLLTLSWATAVTRVEKVRNEKVVAYEETLAPTEIEAPSDGLPSVTVFLSDGTVMSANDEGKPMTLAVKRGQVIYRKPGAAPLEVTGATEVRFVRVELRGKETTKTWGTHGFGPDSTMLVENGYVRAYNIAIPAGITEPEHTHHDRIVVCLSGAQLRHVLPDKREEDSSIQTDACLWRRGQTHMGKNIGRTDLWVIAIEPK